MQGTSHKRKRPVFLNLLIIRLPIGGVVSIIHRVTGVLLVVLLPPVIYLFQLSLRDATGYSQVIRAFEGPWIGAALLILLGLLVQHLLSGVRHLLLDLDIGIAREKARITAWTTLAGTAVLVSIFGIWLCGR